MQEFSVTLVLGLVPNLGFWNGSSKYSKGVIRPLDTKFSHSHPSFDDVGMPHPPTKWKGKCEFMTAYSNKVIGARLLIIGETMPFDHVEHVTHMTNTVTRSFVESANIITVGMAPHAHIAV
ncbi:hypothetical protein RD792_009103 [Penstemon davidsonii]|uniref:Neutral/alkaline non-lysosomal ceramidase N-terminal domain-containing protein n=1 Tax=Penstemon davidsonii TaxID=160366 RepID=A0ABR0DCJ5_9LAMI|nr:hypothetical protein RD792_009103 [Penstemon davidsonii]